MRPISLRNWAGRLPRRILRRLQGSTIRLGLFIAFVCLCVIASEAWRAVGDRQIQTSQAQTAMENLARSLVQHAEDTLELADAAVYDVVTLIERGRLGPERLAELDGLLLRRAAATPRLGALLVFDAQGRWLAGSLAIRPDPLPSVETRGHFRHHQDSLDRAPFISPATRDDGGAWVMTVSRRLEDGHGQFAGIVVATIDSEYFARRYAAFDIGRHGVIALFSAAGSLLARHPFDPATIGGDLSGEPLFREEPPRPYGSYGYVSRFDGMERLSGFARGQRFPLLLTAAVARGEALASWRAAALARFSIAATICVVVVVLGWMLMAHVRRRQRLEQQLALLARTDSLTDLPNRRALDHELQREWRRAARLGTELSVLMLDLDRFKAFNDGYGHLSGDACLRAVGEAVAGTVGRARDFVARYGGEEIAVLLPDTSGPQAVLIAENIRAAIEALAIPHAGNPPGGVVTTSVGVATVFPLGEHSPARLLEAADRALYEAKEAGRNRVATAQGLLLRAGSETARRTA